MTEVNKGFAQNITKVPSIVYGEIEGNRPVVFSKYNNERYGKGMKTEDIPGAANLNKKSMTSKSRKV